MIDNMDSIIVLICAALVLFMAPAAGIIYASSNKAESIMRSWVSIGVVTVLWFLFGFSLAYGTDHLGILGGGEYFLLKNISILPNDAVGNNTPPIMFFVLQAAIAVFASMIACTIASGKLLTLKAYILFLIFWNTCVYIPMVHMVWDQGLLSQIGLLDYAGGTVIHISAGFSALAVATASGNCQKKTDISQRAEYISVGGSMLLIGFLALHSSVGFGINEMSAYAVCTTVLGAASGIVVWLILAAVMKQRIDIMNVMMGCFAGLIGVASGAAYVTPQSGFLIGGIVSLICYFCMRQKDGILAGNTICILHGIGGMAGTILTGVFADPALCTLPHAIGRQLITQMGCAYAAAIGSYMWTKFILTVIGHFLPLYMPEDPEIEISERIFAARKRTFGGEKQEMN